MNGKIRIGIDIGGTNIEACAAGESVRDINEVLFAHRKYPRGADLGGLCSCLEELIRELAGNGGFCSDDVISCGIAMPGALDTARGRVIHAYNLGLHDAPVVEELGKATALENLQLLNDADAAAWGELKLGALAGVTSGCLITLGTGVGAGLIIDGRLYTGGRGRGTEPGHMTLDLEGRECTCGNRGCVETLCSATYLEREGRRAFSDDGMTAKRIADMAREGDVRAKEVFDRYTDNLSAMLASYIALLDPERIALGGGVSLAGDILFSAVREKTERRSFFKPICDIVSARLGDRAGAIGAALYSR